jgi:DNA recombination protein RmuC
MLIWILILSCLLAVAATTIVWLFLGRRAVEARLAEAVAHSTEAERRAVHAEAGVAERDQSVADLRERAQVDANVLREERDRAIAAHAASLVDLATCKEQLVAAERQAAERREFLEQQIAQLEDRFAKLANDSLTRSSEQFLKLASTHFEGLSEKSGADLEQRKQAIAAMVEPIGKTLDQTRERLDAVEKARAEAFGRLDERLLEQVAAAQQLSDTALGLSRALSRPEVRGRYGEIQLRRVAELAGMVSYCDFTEQTSTRDDAGRLLRPDMIVRLPNDRVVAVDAKCNIDAYVRASESNDADERERLLEKYANDVVDQSRKLSAKGYWKEFEGSPEFVVMFVPGDHFLDAALSRRSDLLDVAAGQNVILASPATLIGLLRAVAIGWRERSLADNAEKLYALGRELHERAATMFEHAERVGRSLHQATEHYNKFVASAETRLLPTLRKFEDAGARSGKDLPDVPMVSVTTRELSAELRSKPLLPMGETGTADTLDEASDQGSRT